MFLKNTNTEILNERTICELQMIVIYDCEDGECQINTVNTYSLRKTYYYSKGNSLYLSPGDTYVIKNVSNTQEMIVCLYVANIN